MKRIRLENPDIDMVELEMRASEEVMAKGPKSRAYYRLQGHDSTRNTFWLKLCICFYNPHTYPYL